MRTAPVPKPRESRRALTLQLFIISILLLGLFAQNIVLAVGEASATLQASADNYPDSKYPHATYGHVSVLYVGNSYDHSLDHGPEGIWGSERIYIRFNLTELPKGRIIKQATLRLWQYYAPASEETYEAHRVLGDWDEHNQNWNNQPPWASAKTSDAVAPARREVAVEWDIASDVKAWYSGEAPNYGTVIKVASEGHVRDASSGFWSREYPVEEWKPRLTIVLQGDPALTYAARLAVAGLPRGVSSTVSVDGQPYSVSTDSALEFVFDKGTTHTIQVSQLVSGSTGTRYRSEDSQIGIEGATSHVFVYTTENLVTFLTEPSNLFQTPSNGWYQRGAALIVNRTGPAVIDMAPGVRLVFDGWYANSSKLERVAESSLGTVKATTIVVNGSMTVDGRYRTEYYLNVSSRFGETEGSGWHPKSSTASFSIDRKTIPVEGLLGLLGLKYSFARWSGSSNFIGYPTEAQGSIAMKEPTRIGAVWQEDWSSLFINVFALLVVVLSMFAVIATVRKRVGQT